MAKLQTKWIADLAVTGPKIANSASTDADRAISSDHVKDSAVIARHLASAAKQSVLESKLIAKRVAVTAFSPANASSDDVSTEVVAAATTDTPRTDLTAKGIYVGAVSGQSDIKKVLIRNAGTDEGIPDGLGNEVYGVLTEDTGVFTLSYKKSSGAAHTMAGTESIDFLFVEVKDLYSQAVEDGLAMPVGGVIDATAASAIENHKSDGEAHGGRIADLVTLSGVAANAEHLGTFTGTTIADSSTVKAALQALETATEAAASAASAAQGTANTANSTANSALSAAQAAQGDVDNLVTLSGVAVDSVNLGSFTGTTINDNVTIKAALQALETAVETVAGDVGNLVTLSGVAVDSTNLGEFTGSTIADNRTIKAALQDLETALEGVTGYVSKTETLTLDSTDITNKYKDLASTAAVVDPANSSSLCPVGGPRQEYGVDYTIITNGSIVKRVNWNGLALDGVLEAGDKLIVSFEV